ncbi:MAG: hypothetical protein NFCOHLIN_02307 [Gammaproteobacteria bacterium]|nr:hypothetical protein [Gammaproteobacteria bacterium]
MRRLRSLFASHAAITGQLPGIVHPVIDTHLLERAPSLAQGPGTAGRHGGGPIRLLHRQPAWQLEMRRTATRHGFCRPDDQETPYFEKVVAR